ncbi:MAG: hypothetical protein ACJAZ9_001985 [Neolewinella sp.]|jgi:hypothetical protein
MSDTSKNVIRFVVLLFLQVFLFRQVSMGFGGREHLFLFITPLFIALLPLRTPAPIVVALGFTIGLGTDFFYETLGLHAAAGSFAGYARQFLLRLIEPKDGYKVKSSTDGKVLGRNWWASYLAMLLFCYCLFYFSIEAFSHVYWRDIVLKTVFTTPVSWIVCLVMVLFMRPRM